MVDGVMVSEEKYSHAHLSWWDIENLIEEAVQFLGTVQYADNGQFLEKDSMDATAKYLEELKFMAGAKLKESGNAFNLAGKYNNWADYPNIIATAEIFYPFLYEDCYSRAETLTNLCSNYYGSYAKYLPYGVGQMQGMEQVLAVQIKNTADALYVLHCITRVLQKQVEAVATIVGQTYLQRTKKPYEVFKFPTGASMRVINEDPYHYYHVGRLFAMERYKNNGVPPTQFLNEVAVGKGEFEDALKENGISIDLIYNELYSNGFIRPIKETRIQFVRKNNINEWGHLTLGLDLSSRISFSFDPEDFANMYDCVNMLKKLSVLEDLYQWCEKKTTAIKDRLLQAQVTIDEKVYPLYQFLYFGHYEMKTVESYEILSNNAQGTSIFTFLSVTNPYCRIETLGKIIKAPANNNTGDHPAIFTEYNSKAYFTWSLRDYD